MTPITDRLRERCERWLESNPDVPYDRTKEAELDAQHHNEAYELITALVAALTPTGARTEAQLARCTRCGHIFESHCNAACMQGCYECDCPGFVDALPAVPGPQEGEEAEKLRKAWDSGHFDGDCEVAREVGWTCTCKTPDEKAERQHED